MASVEQNQQTDLEKFVNQNNPPTEGDLSGFSALNSRNSGNFSFANSGTPKAEQNSGFSVSVQNTVPATVLNDGTTIADVFDERDRLEARQGQKPFDLDAIGKFTEPTPFNNPQAFVEDMLFGEQEPSQTAKDIAGLRGGVTDTISGISDELTTAETRARKETGIGTLSQDLAKTNEAIARRQARFRRESREFLSDAQERGVAREFVTRQQQKMKADATAELADLYIVQNAQSGNVEAARDFIDTAVDNRYRNIEIELNEKRAQIEELLPTLEGEEKERAQLLQIALDERANNLDTEREEAGIKRELLISAASIGATETERRNIMNGDLDQAYDTLAKATARQFRDSQVTTGGSIKAPTIKTINGVDYQWNDQLGIWEDVAVSGGGGQAQETVDNLAFLLDTADRVIGSEEKGYEPLYKGAGQSVLGQKLGRFFKGQTATTRLEAQVDTLRSNMLTLATDPSIKKFFGPQMSDADVRLMTAAGTTLRPDSQKPKELLDEAVRIQDLLNRMKTAVETGSSSSQNIITAPDGTLIQIVD